MNTIERNLIIQLMPRNIYNKELELVKQDIINSYIMNKIRECESLNEDILTLNLNSISNIIFYANSPETNSSISFHIQSYNLVIFCKLFGYEFYAADKIFVINLCNKVLTLMDFID